MLKNPYPIFFSHLYFKEKEKENQRDSTMDRSVYNKTILSFYSVQKICQQIVPSSIIEGASSNGEPLSRREDLVK